MFDELNEKIFNNLTIFFSGWNEKSNLMIVQSGSVALFCCSVVNGTRHWLVTWVVLHFPDDANFFFHKKYRRSFKTLREGIVHIPEKKRAKNMTWPNKMEWNSFWSSISRNITVFSWNSHISKQSSTSLWVSRVLKYQKVFRGFDNIFHVYLIRGFQKYKQNWILTMAFWVTCKITQPIQPIWQHIFALPKSALKKPPWEFNFFHIFEIPSSSRHEKCCQILQTLFWVFQYSRNSQWQMSKKNVVKC